MQKYAGNASDPNGRAIDAASVLVTTSTGAVAQLYSDNGVTTRANPIITGPDGEYAFYAANGRYSLAISAAGYATDFMPDVLLHDPADSPSGGGGVGDVTLDGAQTLTNKTLTNPAMTSQVLADNAIVAWNAANGQVALVTIQSTARTIALPTNLKAGGIYWLKVVLGAANLSYSFAAGYIFTAAPVISTASGAQDVYLLLSDGVSMFGAQHARTAAPAPAPPPPSSVAAVGTNLSGMEWARPNLRYGPGTEPNINYTPPRAADVTYLKNAGMTKNRLPIQWELLQPVLLDSPANATVITAHEITAAGQFNELYANIITGVLDAHAAAGIKCIIDLHNYFRYQDFIFNADGSVTGFTDPTPAVRMPYTTDNSKVRVRIATKTTIPAGTHYYKIAAKTAAGVTTASNEVSQVALADTSAVNLSWAAITGATGYRIHRGSTAGGQSVYYDVGAVTSYADVGGPSTTGTPAGTNTATLPAPVQTAPSTSTGGGTLAAATYYYKVTATNAAGQTIGSNEQSQVTTGTTSSNTINWGAVAGATGYRIYRGTTAGGEDVYYSVGAVVTFLDTGAANTAGSPPGTNTATIAVPVANATTVTDGVSVKLVHYTDFWQRVAARWGGHAGFGGYGLMNEPNTMPAVGGLTEGGNPQDVTIAPAYHQAAINTIRAVDATGPIYVSSNNWQGASNIDDVADNPNVLMTGTNLIYEVHTYLDAFTNGANFDYDIEVAKNFSAGLDPSNVPIDSQTAYKRIKQAVDWAIANNVKLALGEIGMPVDDVRWQTMYKNAVDFAHANGCEIYSWMGGNHWPIHNYAINHVPGFHQGKTQPPLVQSVLRGLVGLNTAVIFDDGDGWSTGGAAVTIAVYARGNLTSPVALTVASNNGGTFSKTALTLAAGANSFDSFTFTPLANSVTTLTYTGPAQVPPARKVYSLTDPVAYAATNLTDAANAIMAKYKASKWEIRDSFTDYMDGAPVASVGQPIRAIPDSGWGSSAPTAAGSSGNTMEMKLWINKDAYMPAGNDMIIPTAGITGGKIYADKIAYNTWGWWCKKVKPNANGVDSQPNPKNKALYNLEDPHFQIVALAVGSQTASGSAFYAGITEDSFRSRISFTNAIPAMNFVDGAYVATTVSSSAGALATDVATVVGMTSVQGSQKLYVDKIERGSATRTHAAAVYTQMMFGMAYHDYYPQLTFRGKLWGAISGKGAITVAEYGVLSDYLATLY